MWQSLATAFAVVEWHHGTIVAKITSLGYKKKPLVHLTWPNPRQILIVFGWIVRNPIQTLTRVTILFLANYTPSYLTSLHSRIPVLSLALHYYWYCHYLLSFLHPSFTAVSSFTFSSFIFLFLLSPFLSFVFCLWSGVWHVMLVYNM